MKIQQRSKNAYLILFCAVTGAAVLMRTIASFLYLSPFGYYTGALGSAADYTAISGLLLLLTYAILHRKDAPRRASFGGMLTYVPAAPLALCFIYMGVLLLLRKAEGTLNKIALPLLGLLAIASALYFFFAVLLEAKQSDLRAAFGTVTSLFLILYAGYLYFDPTLPINATSKLCDQMAYIAAAIFFLFETRVSLGRVRWPLYTAFGLGASLLTAYSAVPSLILYVFKGEIISNSLEEILLTLLLAAYIICRTVLSLMLKEETPTALMAALQENARLRAEAVAAEGPLPFEPQPDQTEKAEEEAEATAEQTENETAPIPADNADSTAEEGEESAPKPEEDENEKNSDY